MKTFAAILTLSLLTPLCAGAAMTARPAEEDCGAKASQPEMNECFDAQWRRADKTLNTSYQRRLAGMKDDPKGADLFRAAERAWVAFRDKNCAFEANSDEGGSIYTTTIDACLIRTTEARRKEIEAQN